MNDNQEVKNKEDEEISKKGLIKMICIYAVIFILMWKVIPTYIVSGTIVDGESMQDTLQPKQALMINRFSYLFNDPERFDIVTLKPFGLEDDNQFIKRIIGLPGETIQIKDEKIYINNKVLDENYGNEPTRVAGIAKDPIVLGDDEYFVMGDNRNHSGDSREEFIGPIKRKLILGKVGLRIYPLDKIGRVK